MTQLFCQISCMMKLSMISFVMKLNCCHLFERRLYIKQRSSSMDRRLIVLAAGMFAIGTDSFVVAGILPNVSKSLGVSVGVAGQMVTVYALSYALLSPVIAATAAHWPRKRLLLAGLAVFVLGNLATALAPTIEWVLASRLLAGLGAAMFSPTATATGASLVPPEKRARALAIVIAGLSSATALGAPMGTFLAAWATGAPRCGSSPSSAW